VRIVQTKNALGELTTFLWVGGALLSVQDLADLLAENREPVPKLILLPDRLRSEASVSME
jgi:hypothetical protein